jgi:hypothetical protein
MMKTTITIPEKQTVQQIMSLKIKPGSRYIVVAIQKENESRQISVDLLPILKEATTAQKTIIKTFLKQAARLAIQQFNAELELNITTEDFEGEIFDETESDTNPII